MQRRAALGVAAAVTAAVLGASTALAAGSGLFGGIDDPGAGQLAPVLTADPSAVPAGQVEVVEVPAQVPAEVPADAPAAPAPAASGPAVTEGGDDSSGHGRGRGRGRGRGGDGSEDDD